MMRPERESGKAQRPAIAPAQGCELAKQRLISEVSARIPPGNSGKLIDRVRSAAEHS